MKSPRKNTGPQRADHLEPALAAEREALRRLFDLPPAVPAKGAAGRQLVSGASRSPDGDDQGR